jgi:hypothetical protein
VLRGALWPIVSSHAREHPTVPFSPKVSTAALPFSSQVGREAHDLCGGIPEDDESTSLATTGQPASVHSHHGMWRTYADRTGPRGSKPMSLTRKFLVPGPPK